MDEKGRNVIIIIVALIIAIAFGYVVMYIKTPTVVDEVPQNKTVEDLNIDSLNFEHYLYDVDGNSTNETSAKIMNNNVYLYIDDNEYILNNFGNPVSVRVEHAIKDTEFNVIFVLTPNKLYYLSDVEYEGAINSKKSPVFNECEIENPVSMAIINEIDSDTDYKYPTVYLKTADKKIYVSKFGNEFVEYKKKE